MAVAPRQPDVRPDTSAGGGRPGSLGGLLGHHPDTGLLLSQPAMLALLIRVFSFTAERFLTQAVMISIATPMSISVIAGTGITIVLTSGGIDISIGSLIRPVATVMGILMVDTGMPAIVAIVAALVSGAVCGTFNGFRFAHARVPPIIVTLDTTTFCRGLAYLLGDGKVCMRFPDPLPWLGDGRIPEVPVRVHSPCRR